MAWQLSVHRSYDGHFIDALGQFGEQIANGDPALSVLFEGERRGESHSGFTLGFEVFKREDLPSPSGQLWLGVEGIDLRDPAVEKHVDHVFCRRWEMQGQGPR